MLGSRLNNTHLNAILKAIASGKKRGMNGESTRASVNGELADVDARTAGISENYIRRVIQLGKQGYSGIYFQSTTRTGIRRPTTRSVARTRTTRSASAMTSWSLRRMRSGR